ncbi:MAG: hypothetical protein VB933_08390 [Pseudomonadales bacterium]
MNSYDGRIECLGGPIANFLDGLVNNLFAAGDCHECPLRAVVYIVFPGLTGCDIRDTTELIA